MSEGTEVSHANRRVVPVCLILGLGLLGALERPSRADCRRQRYVMNYFFPETLGAREAHYSWILLEMMEPSIYRERRRRTTGLAAFRLLIANDPPLPSYVVRADIGTYGGIRLTTKKLVRLKPSYVPCTTRTESDMRVLPPSEGQRLLQAVDARGFWQLPPLSVRTVAPGRITLEKDSSEWVLEGQIRGQYHAISRRSPPRGAAYHLAVLLLRMAGLERLAKR
jgi:hypothetical protein